MKWNKMVALLAVLATMTCSSCKDEEEESRYPLAIGDRLYFSPDKSMAYDPIAFEELPEFVQEVLNGSAFKVCEFVYSGFWMDEKVYLVRNASSILLDGCDGGFLYLENGTSFGLLSNKDMRQMQIDIDNWVCVYFWIDKNW